MLHVGKDFGLFAEITDPALERLTKLDERPGLGRLLGGVDEGRFDVVLVVDESRLARDELVAALIRDRLKRAGVLVATLSGERDLTDP
ncbi:MAG: recombinase family protein, partial [Actinomycetota bacterium]|nr:recombinase family protein [Actinomycetota bacterium]